MWREVLEEVMVVSHSGYLPDGMSGLVAILAPTQNILNDVDAMIYAIFVD